MCRAIFSAIFWKKLQKRTSERLCCVYNVHVRWEGRGGEGGLQWVSSKACAIRSVLVSFSLSLLPPFHKMSNQTTLVCDVIPVWTGYIWGAQGGATFDICSLFLVTVPPFLALYFGVLYFLTTLEGENNILERFDAKVESFNARVERIILALKRKDIPGQLVDVLPDLPDLSEVPSFIAAYAAYSANAKKRFSPVVQDFDGKDFGQTLTDDSWERIDKLKATTNSDVESTNTKNTKKASEGTQYYSWGPNNKDAAV